VQDSGYATTPTFPEFNMEIAPKFVSPATDPAPTTTGNYRLNGTAIPPSPAIDNGGDYPSIDDPNFDDVTNTAVREAISAALTKDLAGNPRKNGAIDMGAYEFY
jgi:hypothetical protein